MDIKQINSAIAFGNFTNDELNAISDTIKYARARLVKSVKSSINVGSTVEFRSTRTNRMVQGRVLKIGIKYATVDSPAGGRWKVPMNMLSLVDQ